MNYSLLIPRDNSHPYALKQGQSITPAEFIADITSCADSLPSCRYLINLCTDRYKFSVAFFAAVLRKQINLLPPKRSEELIQLLRSEYKDCMVVVDSDDFPGADLFLDLKVGGNGASTSPKVNFEQDVAIAFTSGSTGKPQAHTKTWNMLSHWREEHLRNLPNKLNNFGLVATVPSWHMYGLEWALMLPSVANATLYCGADFFPGDVVAALNEFAMPTLLVSTPVHLRALLKSPAPKQAVEVTLSATAPLDDVLANQVEKHLRTQILEIYGCSEIGSLASRTPSNEQAWKLFDCFEYEFVNEKITINSPYINVPVTLSDRFSEVTPGHFNLLGRDSDIIKVAGKRESLANLNHELLAIPGVEDGVFFQPEMYGLPESGRLAALVVAPTLEVGEIKSCLTSKIDPVFIPRPIYLVDKLPREITSKLSRQAMRRLVTEVHES